MCVCRYTDHAKKYLNTEWSGERKKTIKTEILFTFPLLSFTLSDLLTPLPACLPHAWAGGPTALLMTVVSCRCHKLANLYSFPDLRLQPFIIQSLIRDSGALLFSPAYHPLQPHTQYLQREMWEEDRSYWRER